jgi:hypothetical protein
VYHYRKGCGNRIAKQYIASGDYSSPAAAVFAGTDKFCAGPAFARD